MKVQLIVYIRGSWEGILTGMTGLFLDLEGNQYAFMVWTRLAGWLDRQEDSHLAND